MICFSLSVQVYWEVAERLSKHSGQSVHLTNVTVNHKHQPESRSQWISTAKTIYSHYFSVGYSEIVYNKSGPVVVLLDECRRVFWPMGISAPNQMSVHQNTGRIIHPAGARKSVWNVRSIETIIGDMFHSQPQFWTGQQRDWCTAVSLMWQQRETLLKQLQ